MGVIIVCNDAYTFWVSGYDSRRMINISSSHWSNYPVILVQYMTAIRLVIASQLCESKPTWTDDNGREECWKAMGGLVVDWIRPLGENEWFGENDASGVLRL